MKLTIEQTNKILNTLHGYKMEVIDLEVEDILKGLNTIAEDYFYEKVNEALDED